MDLKCAEKVVEAVQRERRRMTFIALECGASATKMAQKMNGITRQRVYQLADQGGRIYEEEQADEAQG